MQRAKIMIEKSVGGSTLRLLASSECEFEGEALVQLTHTVGLAGMKIGVGFPDLHPGRGIPVGAAFLCTNRLYPHVIGSDVGCGIGLWQTLLPVKKVKRDRLVTRLAVFPALWEGDTRQWLAARDLSETPCDTLHGTIGAGNHFAELQAVNTVYCRERFQHYSLDERRCFLLVHSGSRGLGEVLLRSHVQSLGACGIAADSPEAQSYLARHDFAVRWAESNRALIAMRFAGHLGTECEAVLDNCHNSVRRVAIAGETGWLHRKGAAAGDSGPLVIAGTRGSLSYLVEPLGDLESTLNSLAHGAGRKWNRSSCKARLRQRFTPQMLSRTGLGSVVICSDKELLYEEAPQAYKSIERVMERLQNERLVRVIASLKPIITYKQGGTP